MSRITVPILPQNYEYVRDRIAEILIDEFQNQLVLTGEYDNDIDVYVERDTPFAESDLPVLNVLVDTGAWDSHHQGSSRGTYIINIDCITSSKSTSGQAGDTSSAIKAQRLAGIVRAILENPVYKTLGFTPPFISRVFCSDMKFGKPSNADANNQAISRVVFHVVVCETTSLIVPTLIAGYDTVVKVNNTQQGYQYIGENY